MVRSAFESRKYVIGGIALVIVITYIVRLAFLQLGSEEYKANADSNAFFDNIIFPSRGVLYDRNGELLVYNQLAYDIMVVMREVEGLDTLDFCNTLGITKKDFDDRMAVIKDRNRNPGYSSYTQQLFIGQMSAKDFSVFQEKMYRFRGFSVRERTIRRYATKHGAHILGDVAEVAPSDVERDPYYSPGDYIGKQGVERSYEQYLRGEISN